MLEPKVGQLEPRISAVGRFFSSPPMALSSMALKVYAYHSKSRERKEREEREESSNDDMARSQRQDKNEFHSWQRKKGL